MSPLSPILHKDSSQAAPFTLPHPGEEGGMGSWQATVCLGHYVVNH